MTGFFLLASPNSDNVNLSQNDYLDVDIADFLFRDFMFVNRIKAINSFPPFEVMKNYFLKGTFNHGMSGYEIWKPYDLDHNGYNYIRSVFASQMTTSFQTYHDLEVLKKYDHWLARSFKYITRIN